MQSFDVTKGLGSKFWEVIGGEIESVCDAADFPPSSTDRQLHDSIESVIREQIQIELWKLGFMGMEERANPANATLLSVCYSPSLRRWCAVGQTDGIDTYIVCSSDGVTWTTHAAPANVTAYKVIWSERVRLFIAVGDASGGDAYIMTSAIGIGGWTERANPLNENLFSVCESDELRLFVAVGFNGGILTSPDGITWTLQASPSGLTSLRGVAWGKKPGVFVALDSTISPVQMIVSPDGINWTRITVPCAAPPYSIEYSKYSDRFVASNFLGTTYLSLFMFSDDGYNWRWTAQASVTKSGYRLKSFLVFPHIDLIVGLSNASRMFFYFSNNDGDVAYVVPGFGQGKQDLLGIAFSIEQKRIVAVGNADGTDAFIMTMNFGV